MYKRGAIFIAALAIAAVALSASGQTSAPLEVKAARQTGSGLDRIFEFDVTNSSGHELFVRGRLVLLNVYDASLPVTVLVPDVRIPAHGMATVGVTWVNAPLVGQIRALLVLNDGQDPSLIQPFVFWVFPIEQAVLFVGIAALAIAVALGSMRLPKYLKARVPANMLAYVADEEDTVVTLSSRFDVTWQDVVRANRLKPPYTLKAGKRILIPKHGLRKPEENV